MTDSYRHKGLRKQLITILKEKGIDNEQVLGAINAIPRHFFLDKAFEEWAYQDYAFPIGNEQTISQPYTVAIQTTLMDVKKGDKILEIGTGSGYQASVLAYLGANVYTLERQELLHKSAKKLLHDMGFRNTIHFHLVDGFGGLPEEAPYDKILVTAGATEIPQKLLDQLKIGGFLIIPVGDLEVQKMTKITRISATEWQNEVHGDFRFVPFVKGLNRL